MKVFCSGIGGIGLSAYASLMRMNGHEVCGTDKNPSAVLTDLERQGIRTSLDQTGNAVEPNTDLFVYSEAIPESSPERLRAAQLHIPQMSYPAAVGEMTVPYDVIAVCGTHGKSSTTAMAARTLVSCGMDPTVIVGTKVRELVGRNWRKGSSRTFLLEACEYRRSFLHYNPSVILLTNCDGDHFDYYSSQDDYRSAFEAFIAKLPPDGTLITHGSDPQLHALAEASGKKVVDADRYPLITLQTPGRHMRENARLVLALADLLHIDPSRAAEALSGYAGSWRRLEMKGTVQGVNVVDDYAHHPTEIVASLQALKESYPDRSIICVFQPHTHDRTKKLYADFVKAFSAAHTVIIPNVYAARSEKDSVQIDVDSFVEDITKASGVTAINGRSVRDTEQLLRDTFIREGNVIVCMGAGDVTTIADRLVSDQ